MQLWYLLFCNLDDKSLEDIGFMAHDLGIITKMVLYVLVDSNSTFFYSNLINLMRLNDFFYYFLIRHDCTLKSKKLVKWINNIVCMVNKKFNLMHFTSNFCGQRIRIKKCKFKLHDGKKHSNYANMSNEFHIVQYLH